MFQAITSATALYIRSVDYYYTGDEVDPTLVASVIIIVGPYIQRSGRLGTLLLLNFRHQNAKELNTKFT